VYDVTLRLGPRERRQIERLAREHNDIVGDLPPVSVDEMALSLLQAHLILLKDCPAILPAGRGSVSGSGTGSKLIGAHGVSLSGGQNG